MDIEVLLQMAAIINKHSVHYEATVPHSPVAYMKLTNGKLTPIRCNALKVVQRGKHKNHLHQTRWTIYEPDMDIIIRRLSRHKADLVERIHQHALIPMDVETIVRRASYGSLRLRLIPTAYYVSGNGKTDT